MAIRSPRRCGFYVSDGSLSFCGKRKGGKNAAKTKVLESFSRLGCRPRRSPLTSRTGMCKICTLLSYGLCGAIRWPLTRARAALTQQGYTLRLPCYAQHFLPSFRRGRCPHRPALPRSLSPVGRGNHTSPPGIAPQLMKKNLSLRGRSAAVAIRFPQRCGFYVSDGSLSFCGKRKGGKNAAKNKVLESFSRLGCRPRRSPLTSRTGMCKICTLLSHGLCGAIRWPLTRARAALTQQGYTLRLPCYAQHFLSSFRRGRCPHRPALLYSLSPIGQGDHTSPPGIALQLMKKSCHCEGAPRPRRSVSPSASKRGDLAATS